MPSRYCKYMDCGNNSANKGIHFYRFPKDKNRCELWIKASKNPKLVEIPASKHYVNSFLCDRHFQDWCFMNPKLRNRLVHNAVPDAPKVIKVQNLGVNHVYSSDAADSNKDNPVVLAEILINSTNQNCENLDKSQNLGVNHVFSSDAADASNHNSLVFAEILIKPENCENIDKSQNLPLDESTLESDISHDSSLQNTTPSANASTPTCRSTVKQIQEKALLAMDLKRIQDKIKERLENSPNEQQDGDVATNGPGWVLLLESIKTEDILPDDCNNHPTPSDTVTTSATATSVISVPPESSIAVQETIKKPRLDLPCDTVQSTKYVITNERQYRKKALNARQQPQRNSCNKTISNEDQPDPPCDTIQTSKSSVKNEQQYSKIALRSKQPLQCNNGNKRVSNEDQLDIFLKNIACRLSKVGKTQRILVEKIFNDALFEAEMGTLTLDHRLVNMPQQKVCTCQGKSRIAS